MPVGEATSTEARRALRAWVSRNGLDPNEGDPKTVTGSAFLTGWLEGRNALRAQQRSNRTMRTE